MRHRIGLLLCLPALCLVGFDGGCGTGDNSQIDLPDPKPEVKDPNVDPPKVDDSDCAQLDELTCLETKGCVTDYVFSACGCTVCQEGSECPPCKCDPAPTKEFSGCRAASACEGLDEAACLQNANCQANYGALRDEKRPADPTDPNGGAAPAQFAGCFDKPVECGAVCDLYCPYGNVVDDNGCPICKCVEPANDCGSLSEADCAASPNCHVLGGATGFRAPPPACDCACDPATAPCNCGCTEPAPPPYQCVPNDPNNCDNLDEKLCVNTAGCHAVYDMVSCLVPPCAPDDAACNGGEGAPACGGMNYLGCKPDENPTPDDCYSYGERECAGHGECTAVYGPGVCPAVCIDPDGDGQCEPCNAPVGFQYCMPAPPPNPCQGEDEQKCIDDPACDPVYAVQSCLAIPCYDADGDGQCDNTNNCGPQKVFVDCQPSQPVDPCQSLGESECLLEGDFCTPVYVESACTAIRPCTDADMDGNCDECTATKSFAGCVYTPPAKCEALDEQTCASTPECAPIYATSGCEMVPPCDENGCYPCDPVVTYAGCAPAEIGPQPVTCATDSDCPNGYCAPAGTTGLAAPNCDPTTGACGDRRPAPAPSECVFPKCGDGSSLLCRMIQPVCDPGFVAAVVNSCWQCLDARACEPPPPPPPPVNCSSDADCPNGYCEYLRALAPIRPCDPTTEDCSAGARIAPPSSMCVFPTCGDGTELMCRIVYPTCAEGETVGIFNGCYRCVDARTCGTEEPPPPATCATDADCPNGYCGETGVTCDSLGCTSSMQCLSNKCAGDGTDLLCDAIAPECAGGTALTVRNGCWACVDARTCQ